jgi:hypothetical protein
MLEGLSGNTRRPQPARAANILGGLRGENAFVPTPKRAIQSVPNYPPLQQIQPEDMGDFGGRMRVNDTGILGIEAEASPSPPPPPAASGESPVLFVSQQEAPVQVRDALPELMLRSYRRKYPMR